MSIATCFFCVFQQTKRLKNFVFGSDHKHFCWKDIFLLIFLFRYQFARHLTLLQDIWLCCKTFDLNPWQNKLNFYKSKQKMHAKLKKIWCFCVIVKGDKMANIKKGKSKTWSEEAINTLIHMTTYGMLPVVIIKTKTESLCL